MTTMVWHQGIHDRMGMQRMRREGVEGAPGLVPWRGKGRSGTGVFAWCLSEFVGIEYRQPNSLGPTEGDQIEPHLGRIMAGDHGVPDPLPSESESHWQL